MKEMMKTEIEIQKHQASQLLTEIRTFVDEKAIIAGGAPRNWLYNKPANDLDIYLQYNFMTTNVSTQLEILRRLLPTVEFKREDQCAWITPYFESKGFDIQSVVDGRVEGLRIQLIFVAPVEGDKPFFKRVMDHMDTGINKVYAMPINCSRLITCETGRFKKDFNNNTITLYPDGMADRQVLHSIYNHLPKMLEYFPGHMMRISCGTLKDRLFPRTNCEVTAGDEECEPILF